MKRLRNISWGTAALVAVSLTSCNKQLEEYNPGGATADAVWGTPQGFVTAVNAAYQSQRYWYGKEDGVFMSETGTDIWINQSQKTYANQVSQYNGLTGSYGYINNTWKNWWIGVNQANAGIGRIDDAGFTDVKEKNKRLAELRFIRAFYYWHIVETWGNVMLRTKEITEYENTAERSTFKDIYDLIFSDLEFAKDNLPNDWGAEYSRATKKSALGMLARAYLSRGYYPDANATECFTKARDYAKDVIDNKGTYGVDLYLTPADLWKPENNKKNKEALYIISNSAASTAYNYDKDGNKEHQYFLANYSTSRPGLKATKEYGRDGGRLLMPTKYLLKLFEPGDLRYDATFQEKWYNNVDTAFQWWDPANKNYQSLYKLNNNKDISVYNNHLTIEPKALALWISRDPIPNKATVNYVAYDIDDIYNATTGKSKDPNGSYPALKKLMDPLRSTDVTSQYGTNDILVIRLAEMYMVAGEAEYKLNNAATAADLFNKVRQRAGATDITGAQITPGWILDERAREFCGEHMRWFDLKRILRGDEWAQYIINRNPDITLIKANHWLRPISQTELNGLVNAIDFGQNQGYN
ncbi:MULTISPECIES: RagB/SusD family nutrient uptake outer membrane protein [Niastella]|uniref:RagB/SusD family nutrient uptake outer membrane protein n=1 Tax=Niastella soli TaxID=2821487 RepID=A0ABS3Z1J0_9BACT|nr:RagB/SusD family nutrient uptake outer membrane protein [Niastella soli]MBO9204036.1 RagB/SusD family nutrient uptake outer membrane protein [Niastella soli]